MASQVPKCLPFDAQTSYQGVWALCFPSPGVFGEELGELWIHLLPFRVGRI